MGQPSPVKEKCECSAYFIVTYMTSLLSSLPLKRCACHVQVREPDSGRTVRYLFAGACWRCRRLRDCTQGASQRGAHRSRTGMPVLVRAGMLVKAQLQGTLEGPELDLCWKAGSCAASATCGHAAHDNKLC